MTRVQIVIRANQITLNRIRQSGSASEDEQTTLQKEITKISEKLQTHKDHAQKSHTYYTDVIKQCKQKWSDMEKLSQSELDTARHSFTLVLSADYQMQKLVPYWGFSPQPGSTYYQQKLSHDIFGIVNHGTEKTALYIFDETAGPKNTDHTVSYLEHYVCHSDKDPVWVRRVHFYLDNTGSTNKNGCFMGWMMDLIQENVLDSLRVSFMITGHTKFEVDRVFSSTSRAYNQADVFNTNELALVMSQAENVGSLVFSWREAVESKYRNCLGFDRCMTLL